MIGPTPGPWMYNPYSGVVEDHDGVPICAMPAPEAETSYEQRILADAKLISQTPELLRCLKLACARLARVDGGDSMTIATCVSAISIATGEEFDVEAFIEAEDEAAP
ncbi:MAG: hypothetical protein WAZ94_15020 [Phycisphaerales bacterium]|nr:hypothetical protein [Chloroflexota bacterium]